MKKLACQIIESGCLYPDEIMAKDALLLDQLGGAPLLHLYDWKVPSLTYGYFIEPSAYLDLTAIESYGMKMARRPTGGGILFHLSDFAFSLLIPASHPGYALNPLENYAFINAQIAEVIAQFKPQLKKPALFSEAPPCENRKLTSFCMAKPTQYDLVVDGKKVGGAAQRRKKQGFLHQGTISLQFPPEALLCKVLKEPEAVLGSMKKNSFCLLDDQTTAKELQAVRCMLRQQFVCYFADSIGE